MRYEMALLALAIILAVPRLDIIKKVILVNKVEYEFKIEEKE